MLYNDLLLEIKTRLLHTKSRISQEKRTRDESYGAGILKRCFPEILPQVTQETYHNAHPT